jgi:hypothetical protein
MLSVCLCVCLSLSLFFPLSWSPQRVVEVFHARSDKLLKRVRLPVERRVEEYFNHGSASGIRRLVEVLGQRRELSFYPGARIDGLVSVCRVCCVLLRVPRVLGVAVCAACAVFAGRAVCAACAACAACAVCVVFVYCVTHVRGGLCTCSWVVCYPWHSADFCITASATQFLTHHTRLCCLSL